MASPQVVLGFQDVYLSAARRMLSDARQATAPEDSAGYSTGAIALSCAALEARLNQYLFEATFAGSIPWDEVCDLLRSSKAVYEKFSVLVSRLSDGQMKAGDCVEYANFVHCVKLRNQLVHYTPAFLKPNEVPRELQSFPAHVIKAPAGQYYWTSVFQTPDVAEWVVDSCGVFAQWFQGHHREVRPEERLG